MTDPEQTPDPAPEGSPQDLPGEDSFADVVSLLSQVQPALPPDFEARFEARLEAALAQASDASAELRCVGAEGLAALVERDADEAWSLAVAIFGEPESEQVSESPAWEALAESFAELRGEEALTSERVLTEVGRAALAVAARRGLEIAPAELLRAEERVGLLLRAGLGLESEDLAAAGLWRRLVEAYPQSGSEELRGLLARELLGALDPEDTSRLDELRKEGPLSATLISEHYREVTEVPPRVCVRRDELAAAIEAWQPAPASLAAEGPAAEVAAPQRSASGRAPAAPAPEPWQEAPRERASFSQRLYRASRRNVPVLVLSGAMALVLSGAVGLIVWKSLAAEERRLEIAGRIEWATFQDRFLKALNEAEAHVEQARILSADQGTSEALSELAAAEARLEELVQLEVEFSVHTPPLRLQAYGAEYRAVTEGVWRDLLLERSRVLVLSGAGQYPEALEAVARGLRDHGRAPAAGSLGRSGRTYLEALASFAESLRDLRVQKGRVEALQGRTDTALATLAAVLAEHPQAHQVHLELSRVLHQRGEFSQAIAASTQALDLEPLAIAAHLQRGESYLALGLPERALTDFQDAIDLDDASFEAYLCRGRAELELGLFGEAQESLSEAIDILPSLPDGYLERGRLFLAQRRLPQAQRDFEVALSRSPTCYAASLELGRTSELLLDEEAAESAYRSVLDAKVQAGQKVRAQAVAALGQLEFALADPLAAGLEFELAHREEGADSRGLLGPYPSLTRLQAGRQKLVQERLRDARYHLEAAIQADPALASARLGRARLALREGDSGTLAAQLAALQTILAARPKPNLPDESSKVDDWGDEYEDAEERALRRGLLEGECLALLGLQARATGQVKKAREQLQAALEADPQSALAKAALGGLLLEIDRERARALFSEAREAQGLTSDEAGFFFAEGSRHADNARRSKGTEHYARARRAFARARVSNPLHARSYLEEGRLCADWTAWDAALECLEAALRCDPFLWEAHHLRGLLLSRDLPLQRNSLSQRPAQLRDVPQGRRSFDEALAIAPQGQRAEAHYGRALASIALAGQGQRDQLQVAWSDLEAALAEVPQDLSQAEPEVFVRARTYLRAQAQVADALQDGARQTQLSARLAAVEAQAAAALAGEIQAGEDLRDNLNYSMAIKRFDQAIALDPKSSKAIFARGTCYLKIGNFVPGILDFSRALELDPRIADQVYNKVYQISYVVDLNRVITEMNKIVADHPKVSHVVFLRGFFYVAYTEFKQASDDILLRGIEDFNRCLELNPKHVTAYLYRSFLYSMLGSRRTEPAKGAPKDEWDLDEDPSGDLLSSRSECFARALEDLEQALELDPKSGIAHYLRALHWARRASEAGIDASEQRSRQERALESLRTSFETEFAGFERVRNERAFNSVRGLPEYEELMRGK